MPAELRQAAYADQPLPIGEGQTISQPYIVALDDATGRPKPAGRALDIGTGSGYQAAVLAEICKDVYSIEIIEPLANQARNASPASATKTSPSGTATAIAAGRKSRST